MDDGFFLGGDDGGSFSVPRGVAAGGDVGKPEDRRGHLPTRGHKMGKENRIFFTLGHSKVVVELVLGGRS